MKSRKVAGAFSNATTLVAPAAGKQKIGKFVLNAQTKEAPISSEATPPLATAESGEEGSALPHCADGNIAASSKAP